MTNRRRFLQALAAAPAMASAGSRATAPGDPARIALVVGNNGYRDAPLANPANDARAMAALLVRAGFAVDTQVDCNRERFAAAVERFIAGAMRPGVRDVAFYYAGHGLQLDWRNYLVPVDASPESAAQVASSCLNLATILRHLGRARDKTFVIILDACRNDPFGRAYRPEQKGLSQFDAPPGSLLAYATAPGGVAEDGEGGNGLYTSHLVRELAVRGVKLEDALKRVRLGVRLASRGAQVPWETTSLETDFYLFGDGRRKLTEEELEAEAEADLATWNSAKASRKPEDMVAYLRKFPNGRFAEMAQMRLARAPSLFGAAGAVAAGPAATATETVAAPPITAATATTTGRPAEPLIKVGKGLPVPEIFRAPASPHSAGKYPLGRRFTVGDEGVGLRSSPIGSTPREYSVRVTKVEEDRDRVEWTWNDGESVWATDLMGNASESGGIAFDPPRQFLPLELYVGNRWRAAYRGTRVEARAGYPVGEVRHITYEFAVTARERIVVPSGEFDAFRIEGVGRSGDQVLEERIWVLPYFNFQLRWDRTVSRSGGSAIWSERRENVSARQFAIGS